MPKSYWTKIQTPDGLKYFRADDVTDELMQKVKDAANAFYATYIYNGPDSGNTSYEDIKAAYDAGRAIYVKYKENASDIGTELFALVSFTDHTGTPTPTTFNHFRFQTLEQSTGKTIYRFPGNWGKLSDRTFADSESLWSLKNAIAKDFASLDFPVAEGTYCTYDYDLYKANQEVATDTWSDSQWTKVDVMSELTSLISEADDVFYVEYGTTTYADALAAYNAGKFMLLLKTSGALTFIYKLVTVSSTAFGFSRVNGQMQDTVNLDSSDQYSDSHTILAKTDNVMKTLSAEIAPEYYALCQEYLADDKFPIPAGTVVTYLDNTSSDVLQYLYKSKVEIGENDYASSDPLTAPAKWDKVHVSDWLGKHVAYVDVLTTPFSEVLALYNQGQNIVARLGYEFYRMVGYSESWGSITGFSFQNISGPVVMTWYVYSDGPSETNNWVAPPSIYYNASIYSIAAPYSEASTYGVGDVVSNGYDLYRCTTDISVAEPWTDAHWTQTTVADEFKRTSNIDTWTEVQISSVSAAVTDFHWCKMYYNDTLKMYSLNFWCTISNISSIALGWNNLFEVDIQDAPNILNFACRSRRGDHDVWISENIVEQIGFIKVAGKVYLRLFNSDTTSSGERLYYAPTISFPATYFSGV